MPREFEGGTDFPFVAVLTFIEPDADRYLQAKLSGNGRNEFRPAG